jgi:serine/threonine protein kinase
MTSVFSARSEESDSPCAIKILREDWEDPETGIKLLQREARAGLSVRHRHLVRVNDAHVTAPPYFLVMDLLPGESLRRRLRRDFRLPISEAVWIIRQTTEALAALHSAGFLHGDLKPDNVRLIDDGTAVLIDLGFAHRPGENASFLRAGYVLGTANYLAPEQCDPLPTEDLSSDVFSLGVMFFELLTGRLPYPPGSLRQTFRRHRCDPPADIRRNVADLPAGLVTLIERMLAHRSDERPRATTVVQNLIKMEIASLKRRRAG